MVDPLRPLPRVLLALALLESTGRAQEDPGSVLQKALAREARANEVLLSARSARSSTTRAKELLASARLDARYCADAAAAQTDQLKVAALAAERSRLAVPEAHVAAFRFVAASDRLRSLGQGADRASESPASDAPFTIDAAIAGRESARRDAVLAASRASEALTAFSRALDAAREARSRLERRLGAATLGATSFAERAEEAASSARELLAVDQRADRLARGTAVLVATSAALESSWIQTKELTAFTGEGARTFEDVEGILTRAMEVPAQNLEGAILVATERSASRYLAALLEANAGACSAGSPCRVALDQEVAATRETLLGAYEEAHREEARLAEAIAGLQEVGPALATLTERSREDERRAEAQERATVAAMKSVAALSLDASSVLEWAEHDHEAAVKAADAAHLAVYGERRPVAAEITLEPAPLPVMEAPPAPVVPASAEPPTIVDHTYEALLSPKPESPGYGAYTYVLFGRRVGEGLAEAERDRYEALVWAIVQSTPEAHEVTLDRSKLNLFCIPSTRAGHLDKKVDQFYDSSLAFDLLGRAKGGAILDPGILQKLRDSAGPFLLTLPRELRFALTTDSMLFADLSATAPTLFPEVVAVYKKTLVTGARNGQAELAIPLKLAWASGIATTAGAVEPILREIAMFLKTLAQKAAPAG